MLAASTVALSPDGRRIAYTTRSDRELAVILLDLENPARQRTLKLPAASDRSPPGSDD